MRKYRQDINLLKQSGLADDSDEVIAARCKYQTLSRKYSDFSEKWDYVNTETELMLMG